MTQDMLVVYTDHIDTGVNMNCTHVNLNSDNLTAKVIKIATDVWGWTDEDIEVNGDKLRAFLIDPELWERVGRRINWPKVPVTYKIEGTEEAITRCKISVFKTLMMNLYNLRAMAYANRSEAHMEEIHKLTRR